MHRPLALSIPLALLAACGTPRSATPPSPPAARLAQDSLPACTVTGEAVTATWREVRGPGFRFCVPPTWRAATPRDSTGGSARGRWIAGDRGITWHAGPFAPGRGMPVPYNQRQEGELRLGDRVGQLSILTIQQRHSMYANVPAAGDLPALRLVGSADGDAARDEVLVVIGTLRP